MLRTGLEDHQYCNCKGKHDNYGLKLKMGDPDASQMRHNSHSRGVIQTTEGSLSQSVMENISEGWQDESWDLIATDLNRNGPRLQCKLSKKAKPQLREVTTVDEKTHQERLLSILTNSNTENDLNV